MTVSVIRGRETSNVDVEAPTTAGPNVWRVGAIVSGGVKAAERTSFQVYDLLGVADEGAPIPANATISAASLIGNVTSVLGYPFDIRIDRMDDDHAQLYDYLVATATEYETGLPWRHAPATTTPCGDVAATPSPFTFACPASTGDLTLIANAPLLAMVTDAMANRAGKCRLRYALNAGGPSASTAIAIKAGPLTDTDCLRLSLTWTAPNTVAIDHPQGVTLPGASPSRAAQPARAGGATPAAPPARPSTT